MNIGQLYLYYSDPSRRETFLSAVPACHKKLIKKPLVCFDLYIDQRAVRSFRPLYL